MGNLGRTLSDTTYGVLRAIRKSRGPEAAEDMAAGYYDGASRYLARPEGDAAPEILTAAE